MTTEYWRVTWTEYVERRRRVETVDRRREFESEELALHFARQKRIDGGTHIKVLHISETTQMTLIQRYGYPEVRIRD